LEKEVKKGRRLIATLNEDRPEYSILKAYLKNPTGVRFMLLHLLRYGTEEAIKQKKTNGYLELYFDGLGEALKLKKQAALASRYVNSIVEKTTEKVFAKIPKKP